MKQDEFAGFHSHYWKLITNWELVSGKYMCYACYWWKALKAYMMFETNRVTIARRMEIRSRPLVVVCHTTVSPTRSNAPPCPCLDGTVQNTTVSAKSTKRSGRISSARGLIRVAWVGIQRIRESELFCKHEKCPGWPGCEPLVLSGKWASQTRLSRQLSGADDIKGLNLLAPDNHSKMPAARAAEGRWPTTGLNIFRMACKHFGAIVSKKWPSIGEMGQRMCVALWAGSAESSLKGTENSMY